MLRVATVLTVYGIETLDKFQYHWILHPLVATVLTVYGIETMGGIETYVEFHDSCNSTYRLRYWNKEDKMQEQSVSNLVATVLTVYGIETFVIIK